MKNKNLILITLTIVGFMLASKAQIPSYVPTNGLVAWYPFNGNANDLSGNANDGTVYGASLTTDRKGNSNAAYSFNGTNNYIYAGNSSSFNIQNYNGITLSGWFKLNTTSISLALVNFTQGNNNRINYLFDYSTNSNLELMNWNVNNAAVNIYCNNVLYANTWYFVVITSDFTTNTSKLYLNGVLQASSTNTLVKPISPVLNIGKHGGPLPWWLNGSLDDIGVWNRALTQSEVTDLYLGCWDTIVLQPINQIGNQESNLQFKVNFTDTVSSTYQWQTNPNNNGWQNVLSNTTYYGSTSNSLIVKNIQLSNHLQSFRVIVALRSCRDTSNTVYINVNDTCIETVIDTNHVDVYDTNHVTVYDTNYISVTDTSTIAVFDTLIIEVKLNIAYPNSNILKVYPNPANDHVTIDFGNYKSMTGFMLKVVNSIGQIVYLTPVCQQTSYLDLSKWTGEGIYIFQIIDNENRTIEIKKIVIQ